MFRILISLWPIWVLLLLFLAWHFCFKSKESRAWMSKSHPALKYTIIAAYIGVLALLVYALVAPPSEEYSPYRPYMEDIPE